MIRHLAYLAPLALLGLAACDGPQALTKAKEGECYTMTGREPGGAQKWERTECATAGAVSAPIAAMPEETSVIATAAAPACPITCPTVAAAATTHKAARSNRRSTRTATRSRSRAKSKTVATEELEYARVYTPDPPPSELLGPPTYDRSERYEYSYANPPAPPTMERRGHGDRRAYGYSEQYDSRRYYAPPPVAVAPPPPPPAPPAPRYEGNRHAYGQSYSYSESSSASRSSRSGYGCCDRDRPVQAPMNGPHFPVDQFGFLTWRGKNPVPSNLPPPAAGPN